MKPSAAIILALLVVPVLRGDDWPQWRGPNRDGVWHENSIPESFPATGVKILWRAPIGWGYASPVVAQGRVYITDTELDVANSKAREHVRCFDAATGKPIWDYVYEPGYPDWVFMEGGNRGPTPTPVVSDGKLYVHGMSIFFCFDAATGDILWQKNLSKDFEMRVGEFGTDSSPLIEGDMLIHLIGGKPGAGIVALNKNTGAEVWRAMDVRRPYASPIVITAAGVKQLIVPTPTALTSLDPATGKEWWSHRNPTDYMVSTPVHSGERLLVGGLMLKLDADKPGATVLWPEKLSKRVLSNTSTAHFDGSYVYSARSAGGFVCLDAKTGEEVWTTDKVTEVRSGSSIHVTPIGDRVLIYTEKGELVLARLSGKGYEEISRAAILPPTYPFGGRNVNWAPPAYANKCIFARSDKELVCASLVVTP